MAVSSRTGSCRFCAMDALRPKRAAKDGTIRELRPRQAEHEPRAFAWHAEGADLPAVHLDDAFDDEQPEPDAFALLGAIRAAIAYENVRNLLGRNAGPGVRDGEDHLAVARFRAQRDAAAGRREFHGVADQVRQHLI